MSVFTLLIDVDNKRLLSNRFGGFAELPNLDRSDSPSFEIGFLKYNGIQYDFIDYGTASIKFGIGATAATPTEGQFRLTWSGITSNAISYNATTAQIQAALAPVVSASAVTVCDTDSAWLITATTSGIFTGTTAGLGGDAFTLYPQSSVLINTVRNAASDVSMRQVVRLLQSPAVFQDSWENSATTGGATLTLAQQGSASQSQTYSLEIDDSVYAGQYNLIFGDQTAGISFDATASQIEGELAKLTSIGSYLDATGITQPNIRVSGDNGKFGITFVGDLAQTNITTAFSVNGTALFRPPYKTAVVTLGTGQIENFLNCGVTGLTMEIELVENGKPNTVLRTAVTFNQNDLIVTGSAIPAQQASYYTKSEADALFIEDSSGNVDATNRRLKNSVGTTIIDYGASLFGASGMVNLSASAVTIGAYPVYINTSVTATGAVSFGGGMAVSGSLGFYGTSPIAKPSGVNVISNVVSLGLIASSSTYGILPASIYTVTTLASISFGSINANDQHYRDVVVTGANNNNIVLIGLPNVISGGAIIQGVAYKANTVCLSCSNSDNVSINVPSADYRISVIGY